MDILPVDSSAFKNWYQKNSRSIFVIIAAGCMSMAILFQFIGSFTSVTAVFRSIYNMGSSEIGYFLGSIIDDLYDALEMEFLRVISVLGTIIALVPIVFKVIGLYFQWFPEANGSLKRHRTGITFIRVSAIISIVYMGIKYLALIAITTLYAFAVIDYTVIGFLFLFVEIAIVVILTMYYKCLLNICSALLDGIDGRAHTFKGGMLLIVFLGIIAFFSFASCFFLGAIGIFTGIFKLAYNVLIILCLVSLKEDMENMAKGAPAVNRFAFEGIYNGSNGSMGMQNAQNGQVKILDGMNQGEMMVPNGMMINVGKNPQKSQLVVDQSFAAVSGLHVSVAYMGQAGYYVTDYSSNGTFLQNGTRLQKGIQMQLPRQTVLILANQCRIILM